MIHSILKVQTGLFALLILLSSSLALCEVYSINPPLFTEQNQAVEVRAYAEDSPRTMILEWTSDQAGGRIDMTSEAGTEHWSATIPSQDVLGTALRYVIFADYGQESPVSSSEYIVYICPEYTFLKVEAMVLNAKVLVKKKWNSDNDAFGVSRTEEGPEFGPASIACHGDNVYLLDSVKSRVLCFDQDGKSQPPIPLPTAMASDITIDPSDSSLIVVSQLEDKMYRVKNGRSPQAMPLDLKRKLVYPARFSYDPSSETLFAEDSAKQNRLRRVMHKGNYIKSAMQQTETAPQVLSEARGNTIFLRLDNNVQIFAVTLDKPVFCIEESLADSNGVAWILYTLEGDYRIRRLARMDTTQGLAQTAQTDIWFSFDATRRMALTRKGVVLFAGDTEQGRIVRFDYNGGVR